VDNLASTEIQFPYRPVGSEMYFYMYLIISPSVPFFLIQNNFCFPVTEERSVELK
jgi:hypothetical protein